MMPEIREVCWNILNEMKTVDNEWGYHFSYSKESAWNSEAHFLIMTLNPSAKDYKISGSKAEKTIITKTPWTHDKSGRCDFFAYNYKISSYIRALCYEFARLEGKRGNTEEERLAIAEDFADHHCPIASFVPFRTLKGEEIKNSMWEFAEEKQWPSIFTVWLPEVIITMGLEPYTRLVQLLKSRLHLRLLNDGKKRIDELQPESATNLHYAYSRFENNGQTVTVMYIPHPTGAFGYKGLPGRLDDESEEKGTPFRRFLESVVAGK